ncbi:Hypothetical protein DEACI_1075 [Acididesulfobacillus acetoxydans]|uniref:Uncharacterized protein n=1 Tax=Acididesulfobacillus acetoxydans TaxID=1561005 RepID=A0A8S0WET0_9FIRM|nr:Hypothetical protein DEACI_1075 [Acididesulfobacillus acetoxydans]CEJ06556.1 Hypothetical protein DEACI_1005 [Acididesulfobacillus acetoxydans]
MPPVGAGAAAHTLYVHRVYLYVHRVFVCTPCIRMYTVCTHMYSVYVPCVLVCIRFVLRGIFRK